nr:MAG TPA: hypothetical protein [Caudoviricetes sp.]
MRTTQRNAHRRQTPHAPPRRRVADTACLSMSRLDPPPFTSIHRGLG